jgi:hypothetical protein
VTDLLETSDLDRAIAALRSDLLAESGPRISAIRNYPFAILVYPPHQEFLLRKKVAALASELREKDWQVLSLSLQKLLVNRLRAEGDDVLNRMIESERRTWSRRPDRALSWAIERVSGLAGGDDGLAREVIRRIEAFTADAGSDPDRTVIFVGRAGAIYPFLRVSALLRHLDGRVGGLPTVLLYPGERRDRTGLSFMGRLPADRDYRPRIYA